MNSNGERSQAESLTLNTDIPTLTRVRMDAPHSLHFSGLSDDVQHILREQQKLGQAATGDLTILLNAYHRL